jgi:DNA-binding MarR family transcriptional regulator
MLTNFREGFQMILSDIFIKLREVIFEVAQSYREANSMPDLPNLTVKQYCYLDVISRMNNPTYSKIAEKFKVTKPAVTSIVNRLINLGYLERVQSEKDRRVYYIWVSDKGKELIEINNNAANAYASYVEGCLTKDELENYAQILEKIIANYTSKKA